MVLSLLFAQLAVAAYVCPAASEARAMIQAMEAGAPCEGMDTEQPALCFQFGTNAAQTAELAKLPTPSLPAIVHVLAVPVLPDTAMEASLNVSTHPEVRPPPDPVFLATLRLRV